MENVVLPCLRSTGEYASATGSRPRPVCSLRSCSCYWLRSWIPKPGRAVVPDLYFETLLLLPTLALDHETRTHTFPINELQLLTYVTLTLSRTSGP